MATDSCLDQSCYDPSCDGCPFDLNARGQYSVLGDIEWLFSSSPYTYEAGATWCVAFENGSVGNYDGNGTFRCVR